MQIPSKNKIIYGVQARHKYIIIVGMVYCHIPTRLSEELP